VTASSAAAIAQISAAAGVVSYPRPTREGYSLKDAKTKYVGKKTLPNREKKTLRNGEKKPFEVAVQYAL